LKIAVSPSAPEPANFSHPAIRTANNLIAFWALDIGGGTDFLEHSGGRKAIGSW